MKKVLLLSMLSLCAFSSYASERNSPRTEPYEVCYLGDKTIMVQPNMCLAMGGTRA